MPMKISMADLCRFSAGISFCLLLLLTINAYADGMDNSTSQPGITSIPTNTPDFDRPIQVNEDGVVERWDPQTGQWQVLGNDLRFDPDQQVYHNQMVDGRVLFFATREGDDAPDYQALIWNPKSGTVEKPAVSAKPNRNIDIAVMGDGRVMIVNGNEGSADIWDSRTNTVEHNEDTLLENLRWRALPLNNKQILLIATYPDEPDSPRQSSERSIVVLWNPANNERKQIADLPVPFTNGSNLTETMGGVVAATIRKKTHPFVTQIYLLSDMHNIWEMQPYASQLILNDLPGESASSVNLGAVTTIGSSTSDQPPESDWWNAFWVPTRNSNEAIAMLISFITLTFAILFLIRQRRITANAQHGIADELHMPSSRQNLVGLPFILIFTGTMAFLYLFRMGYDYRSGNLYSIQRICAKEKFKLPARSSVELSEVKQWAACVNYQSEMIEKALFYTTNKLVTALPAPPCRYLGVWSSSMSDDITLQHTPSNNYYKFEFTDDSKFRAILTAGSNFFAPPFGDPKYSYWGVWGVVDNRMVLIVNPGNAPADHIFDLIPVDRSNFTLVNKHGKKFNFKLIDSIKSNTCIF